MNTVISLSAGRARCLIVPAVGGSLGGWWIDDWPLLREPTAAALHADDPSQLCGFPLIPYSNRIADGRFHWHGENVALQRQPKGMPHALHGVGWRRPWQPVTRSANALTLQLDHAGDADWPWPFTASQQIMLDARTLTLALAVRNLAPDAVPLAIGHHPYFHRACAHLTLTAEWVWHPDSTQLPERRSRPAGVLDLSRGGEMASVEIDHCYQQVRWPVTLRWRNCPVRLTIAATPPLDCAIIYANAVANALCVEPVAHVSNALNMEATRAAMPVVGPGETICTTITLAASGL